MNKLLSSLFALVLAAGPVAAQDTAADAQPELESLVQKASYAMGLDFGKGLQLQNVDVDADLFYRGLKDALSGAEPLLEEQEAREALLNLQMEVRQKQAEKMQEMGSTNEEEGKKHLAENKEKEGVITTESGLQYEVQEEGTGKQPSATDTVTVHYRGTLLDGTEFDSSHKRGTPATFPLNRVIPGWTEGLQLMKEGGKTRFTIPSDLAYGARGAPPHIGPNATLVFEVELIEVQ